MNIWKALVNTGASKMQLVIEPYSNHRLYWQGYRCLHQDLVRSGKRMQRTIFLKYSDTAVITTKSGKRMTKITAFLKHHLKP